MCKNGPEQREWQTKIRRQKTSKKGTWDAEFGGLPRVVGGAARDQNQGTAVITNQLLGTLDMSRPLNVAL